MKSKSSQLKEELAAIGDALEAATKRLRDLDRLMPKTGWKNPAAAENGKLGGAKKSEK